MFVQRGESFHRLDEELQVGAVLSDNDVIYLVEERFFSVDNVFPVYYKGEEVGCVDWKITYISPKYCSGTVLSLKLRIQELLGFPVSSIDVNFRGKSMKNDKIITHKNVIQTTEIRIEVA